MKAWAVDIAVLPGDTPVVTITGVFEWKDEQLFRDKTGRLSNAVVLFNSQGGNLVAGIEVGTIIRMKGFATAVANGSVCASACAFAWLGGSKRMMGEGARIGFHAASIMQDGVQKDASAGNALAGAYLNRIGMSDRAIIYITGTPFASITWMTPEAARENGIEVSVVRQSSPQASPRPAPVVSDADRSMAVRLAHNFDKRYKEAGMIGINGSIDACYTQARSTTRPETILYCIALDQMAFRMDKAIMDSLHRPQGTQNNIDAAQARIRRLAQDLGFDVLQEARHAAQVTSLAMNELASPNKAQPSEAVAAAASPPLSIDTNDQARNEACSRLATERGLHGQQRFDFREGCKAQGIR